MVHYSLQRVRNTELALNQCRINEVTLNLRCLDIGSALYARRAHCFPPAVTAVQSGMKCHYYCTLLILFLEFFLDCVWIADVILLLIMINNNNILSNNRNLTVVNFSVFLEQQQL